jgi:predicted permease
MPDWVTYIRARLASRGSSIDETVVLEWAQHAEASFVAARADGLSQDEANRRVVLLIDEWCANLGALKPRSSRQPAVEPPTAASRGWTGLLQDFRYGVRLLSRQPGFALMATVLIAIGVGATTTLSSLTYAVLLKPLPFAGADRLIRLAEHRPGETRSFPNVMTNGTYLAWTTAPSTIDALAVWNVGTSTLTVGAEAHRVRIASATASLFAVVPVHPLAGRLFTADEERTGANHVIVLGQTLARTVAALPAEAIDRTVDLDGTPYRVVGVVDETRTFPAGDVSAWTPTYVPPVQTPDGHGFSIAILSGIARLKPGVTAQQAADEATARAQTAPALGTVGTAVFGTGNKPTVTAVRYLDSLTAEVRPALLMMVAAVLLLFVVAIANVAGIQLARMTSRRREVAIRSALGASSGRLARQLLTENLTIGLVGGVGGWLLSVGLHRALPAFLPRTFPRLDDLHADWRVLALALFMATSASLVVGLFPALVTRRLNLVEALVEDSLAPAGGGVRTRIGRLRSGILTGQIAIAVLLLTGASLFGRSFVALVAVDRGYDPHNLATLTLPMPDRQFTSQRRTAALDEMLTRIGRAPGVTAVAASSIMPLTNFQQLMAFSLPPGPGRPEQVMARAEPRIVSPDYFRAMGLRLVRGRVFAASDSPTSELVIVANETFAKRYLPGDPLGAILPASYEPSGAADSHVSKDHTVIGIVADVQQQNATDPPQPELYFDYRQSALGMTIGTPVIIARTTTDPAAVLPLAARYVRDVEPGLVPDSSMTMDERVMASLAQPRLYALLLGTFAGFALLVAGAGLFGALSYSVAQRSREIGVRTALGARPADIVGLVLRQAFTVTLTGVATGLLVAFLLVTLVGTLLYGVKAHDVATFVAVPIIVFVTTALAALGPARRAAAIDPLTAFKKS